MILRIARLVLGGYLAVTALCVLVVLLALLAGKTLPHAGELAFVIEQDRMPGIFLLDVGRDIMLKLTDGAVNPVWSPDGSKIAYETTDMARDIYVVSVEGGRWLNLSSHPAQDFMPTWSPDSSKLAFVSNRQGNIDVFVVNADGTHLVNLSNHPGMDRYPVWSPDGSKLAFVSWGREPDSHADIYVVELENRQTQRLSRINPEDFNDAAPSSLFWLPNGDWIYFSMAFFRQSVVYGIKVENGLMRNFFSTVTLSEMPVWSSDGTRVALPVRSQHIFKLETKSNALTNLTVNSAALNYMPAWSPDGQWLAFVSYRSGGPGLYLMDHRGRHLRELLRVQAMLIKPVWRPG